MAWRAIYCEPRREFLAQEELIGLEKREGVFVDTLCPYSEIKVRKPKRDGSYRHVIEKLAYFPGYIFAETDDIRLVESLRGIVRVLDNADGKPLIVPDNDIAALRRATDETGKMSFVDYTKPSLRFKGAVGDMGQMVNCGMAGFPCEIISLEKLDSHRELTVRVKVFGADREISVPYKKVGHISSRSPTGVRASIEA